MVVIQNHLFTQSIILCCTIHLRLDQHAVLLIVVYRELIVFNHNKNTYLIRALDSLALRIIIHATICKCLIYTTLLL